MHLGPNKHNNTIFTETSHVLGAVLATKELVTNENSLCHHGACSITPVEREAGHELINAWCITADKDDCWREKTAGL